MKAVWEIKNSEKVCGIDIDGVLNYYPDCWVDFINDFLKTDYKDVDKAKDSITYNTYRSIKHEYRTSGIKENLKARDGASETTKRLKELGYDIIILTARPFDNYKTLMSQTIKWLDKNDIKYDSLIQDEHKHTKILEICPNMRFMVEDDGFIANCVAKWGYKVYLLENIYNARKQKKHKDIEVVKNLKEIINLVIKNER